MFGISALTCMQIFANSVIFLSLLLCSIGFFIGMGVPIISVYLAEISPIKNRGRNFMILTLSNPLGLLLIIIIGYFTLGDINMGD